MLFKIYLFSFLLKSLFYMNQFEILLLYWKKNIDMFYLVLVYVVGFLCV